jgi:2,4-dienoyl-CoA reductase-like NADH-dependent reductase (Old Yellow Enzyme family)/thioredoxin reductase
MPFNATFKQMKVRNVLIKNRMIIPPMGCNTCDLEGNMDQDTIDYYEARARGGYGLIIVEVTTIQKHSKAVPNELTIHDDKYIPGFKKLVDVIHKYGCPAMLQLHHAGRQSHSSFLGDTPVSSSSIPCPKYKDTPRELSTQEVYEVINAYIAAAKRAQQAGFDGVELHAAHGYILHQFMSPRSNKRTDEFGGGFEGRTYIMKLIIEGIKRECGEDFPVSVRLSCIEGSAGGFTENAGFVHARLIESYGADMLDITSGSYGEYELLIRPPDQDPAYLLKYVKQIKEKASVPVAIVGRFADAQIIDYVLANGYADMVAVGRQSICDPDLPNKMMVGNPLEYIPCLSCSNRCQAFHQERFDSIGDYGFSCVVNPLGTNRSFMRYGKTDTPKKVVIIGSGPAGLEAAWIAAERGHDVSLFEKAPRAKAGGQFYVAAFPPYKQTISSVIAHYLYMCEKNGVKMVFDKEADEAFIKQQNPDVLIVATGSTPIKPNFTGSDKIRCDQANDVLTGIAPPIDGNVLIIGGGEVGVETADFCTDYSTKVTVVEMRSSIAPEMNSVSLKTMLKRFHDGGIVDLHTDTKVIEITSDGAICEHNGEKISFVGYNRVVLAVGSRSYNPFSNAGSLAKEVYVIGDAKKARSASEAFFEAAQIAIKI